MNYKPLLLGVALFFLVGCSPIKQRQDVSFPVQFSGENCTVVIEGLPGTTQVARAEVYANGWVRVERADGLVVVGQVVNSVLCEEWN